MRKRHKTRSRGAIAWIIVSAVLLGGVVFVNLADLKLNLALNRANQQQTELRASNHALQSQLSAARTSSRLQALARRADGLEPADPSTIGYIDLSRKP